MFRTGFRTFTSPSAQPYGKLGYFDKFQKMDKWIKAVFGSSEVLIFSTIKANTLESVTSGGIEYISKWNPINPTKENQHLTQSSIANMPILSNVSAINQGKYQLVRGIGDDFLEQVETCFDTPTKNGLLIFNFNARTGSIDPSNAWFGLSWGTDYDPYRNGIRFSTQTVNARTASFNLTAVQSDGTTLKQASQQGDGTAQFFSAGGISFLARSFEFKINTTERTGSISIYGNSTTPTYFGLLSPTRPPIRTGSFGYLSGSNGVGGASILFSTASLYSGSATDAEWDYMFDGGYKPSKLQILKNMGDMSIQSIIYINDTTATNALMNMYDITYRRMNRSRSTSAG